jgi:hypothetical protein
MSLDIRVRASKGASFDADRIALDDADRIALDDDGYYWFLHPLFERLRDECGKYIDLYGDALFSRDDFARLRRLLSDAELLARKEPRRTFPVRIGKQLRPVVKDVYAEVDRAKLLDLIFRFRALIDEAERCDGIVECQGD